MLGTKFDDIDLSDFENLIANSISESAVLEYKRELPKWDGSGKHEFLADVWHSPNSVDKYCCQNLNGRNVNAKSQIHS
jgi:hypothetical protein